MGAEKVITTVEAPMRIIGWEGFWHVSVSASDSVNVLVYVWCCVSV
jgi:hypothetical protein